MRARPFRAYCAQRTYFDGDSDGPAGEPGSVPVTAPRLLSLLVPLLLPLRLSGAVPPPDCELPILLRPDEPAAPVSSPAL